MRQEPRGRDRNLHSRTEQRSQGDKTQVAWTEAEKGLQRPCDKNGPKNALGWTD